MPSKLDSRFIFCDIETTGLNAASDVILEVGFVITDSELEVIDMCDIVVWEPEYHAIWAGADDFVKSMHEKSGLIEEAREVGYRLIPACEIMTDFLKSHDLDHPPMTGSSVHFDRGFLSVHMPKVESMFGYRNIDISSVKELCMRMNPSIYGGLDTEYKPRNHHRAISDIRDSINELRFYRDNFFFTL